MDDAIDKFVAELEGLRDRVTSAIESLRAITETPTIKLIRYEFSTPSPDVVTHAKKVDIQPARKKAPARAKTARKRTWLDRVESELRKEKGPLTTTELAKRFGLKDKGKAMASTIRRAAADGRRIYRVIPGVYDLVSRRPKKSTVMEHDLIPHDSGWTCRKCSVWRGYIDHFDMPCERGTK